MKRGILYLIIFLMPVALIVGVNEKAKADLKGSAYKRDGIVALNSSKQLKENCSWACYDNVAFCKKNHVSLTKAEVDQIDPIYNGLFGYLKTRKIFRVTTVLVLWIFMPFFTCFLLVQLVGTSLNIRGVKRNNFRNAMAAPK